MIVLYAGLCAGLCTGFGEIARLRAQAVYAPDV
jgi:hypothetical protein